MAEPQLSVRDLTVRFPTTRGVVQAVNGVSFDLEKGQTLGIVGESGSGKSVTAKTLMNLLPRTAEIGGDVTFEGRDVRALAQEGQDHFWGVEMTMVFQDPMTSLNPVKKCGEQIAETLRFHLKRSKAEAKKGREMVRAMRKDLLQNFRDAGLTVYEMTDAERAAFAKVARAVHKEFDKSIGARLIREVYYAQEKYRARKKAEGR